MEIYCPLLFLQEILAFHSLQPTQPSNPSYNSIVINSNHPGDHFEGTA